jgi:ribosomal-protein-serine acetyltransferase
MFIHRLDDERWLRPIEEADAEELYERTAANREMLAEWMPWAAEATVESTRDFIRSGRKLLADNEGFQAVIVREGRIVGCIGFPRVSWVDRSCEIGYWLAREGQGHGTVTLAARALTDHALRVWKLNRVTIRAGVGNVRSRAIPERLGFTFEGVLRQVERHPDGRYVDLAVYSMLASEWPTSAGPGSASAGLVVNP